MKTKKRAAELQSSYQAIVDSVEDFMVKEGKTLQQAFYAAEEKLDDATEISKEKIQQASSDLKDKLRLLGEAAEGASQAYKEQIKFDLAYVNNSIWEKLQSIAVSNTAELIEFTRTLRENAQTVVTEEHLVAHQEHSKWGADHALWLDEIEFWKKEHAQALIKLAEIKNVLEQKSASLVDHARSIRVSTETGQEHEKIMKNAEQDPSSEMFGEADDKEIKIHQRERQIHDQQSALHHELKTRHFKIMAMVNMLYKETQRED
jgi:hypothetical protein